MGRPRKTPIEPTMAEPTMEPVVETTETPIEPTTTDVVMKLNVLHDNQEYMAGCSYSVDSLVYDVFKQNGFIQ